MVKVWNSIIDFVYRYDFANPLSSAQLTENPSFTKAFSA
jgi:hypothetical protein